MTSIAVPATRRAEIEDAPGIGGVGACIQFTASQLRCFTEVTTSIRSFVRKPLYIVGAASPCEYHGVADFRTYRLLLCRQSGSPGYVNLSLSPRRRGKPRHMRITVFACQPHTQLYNIFSADCHSGCTALRKTSHVHVIIIIVRARYLEN